MRSCSTTMSSTIRVVGGTTGPGRGGEPGSTTMTMIECLNPAEVNGDSFGFVDCSWEEGIWHFEDFGGIQGSGVDI